MSYQRVRDEMVEEYLREGWAVIALCPPDHVGVTQRHKTVCYSCGKTPLHQWRSLGSREQVVWAAKQQFKQVPGANVGVILGSASGIVGLDIDSEEAWDWLLHRQQLVLHGGNNDETYTPAFCTSRGIRLLYRVPKGEVVKSRRVYDHPSGGVDLLAEGKQTVMPPSVHSSGFKYRWIGGRFAFTPGKRIEWLSPEVLELTGSSGAQVERTAGNWAEPGRNDRLFRIASALRRFGVEYQEVYECLRLCNTYCRPEVSDAELRGIAKSACRYQPEYK